MLTIGSLFSGIGGLERGLTWAGLGPVLWQVESDSFCRRVLRKHWPNVEQHEDVRVVGAAGLRAVDLICGGFPCQDTSNAGTRTGLAGSRSGLWRQFARIVGELRPAWVVVENPIGGASRWFDEVVRDLEERDYACLPVPLSASDVGAPHRRGRLFVVAHANGDSERLQPWGGRGQDGADQVESQRDGGARDAADSARVRRKASRKPGPDTQRGADASPGDWWTAQPSVDPVAYGVPERLAQHRAIGNSCTSQQAQVVGEVIQLLRGRPDSLLSPAGPGGTTTHTVGPYGPITDRSESQ